MTTTAKLDAAAKLYHTYLVAVFLTEESDSTKLLCLLDWSVAIFLQGEVLTNTLIDDMLYLTQLLRA